MFSERTYQCYLLGKLLVHTCNSSVREVGKGAFLWFIGQSDSPDWGV